MDTNDSSSKSQQTGGLKLMTVFIFVLALHVLVIGGFTVYHLMSGSGSDADLVLDKTHHLKSDGSVATDAAPTDTGAATSAPSTGNLRPKTADVSPMSTASPTATANPDTQTASPEPATAPVPAPVMPKFAPAIVAPPAPVSVAVAPKPSAPQVIVNDKIVVASTPSLAPPVDSTAPSGPLAFTPTVSTPATMPSPVTAPLAASGPVHMPAIAPKPGNTAALAESPAVVATHKDTYTVKITDSYKKIAHAHHITVAELKAANHIKSDMLHAGQKLVIPGGKTALARSDASLQSGIEPVTASLSASPATTTLHHHTYTVEKGDTLAYIAHKFKTTKAALISENNLSTTAKLAVGRKLKIPTRETRSAEMAVPAPSAPSQVRMTPVMRPPQTEEPAPAATQAAPSAELANMTF